MSNWKLTGYNGIQKPKPKTVQETVNLMVDGFQGLAERDPETGDELVIWIVDKDGNKEERRFPIRFD